MKLLSPEGKNEVFSFSSLYEKSRKRKKSIVSAKQIFEPFFDGGQHFVPKQPNRVYVVLL